MDYRKAVAYTKPKCPPSHRHPVLGRLNPEENLFNISKNNILLLILLCQNKLLVFSLWKDSNSIAIGNSAALNLKIQPINPIKKTIEEKKAGVTLIQFRHMARQLSCSYREMDKMT